MAEEGDLVTFRFSATDEDGDSVSLRVSWGDGDTTDWQPPVAAGDTLALDRRYNPGSHNVRCQALDSRSALSRWSEAAGLSVSRLVLPDSLVAQVPVGDDFVEGKLSLSPDGQIVCAQGEDNVCLVRLVDGAVIGRCSTYGTRSATFAHDGAHIYLATESTLYTLRADDFSVTDSWRSTGIGWLSDICVRPGDGRVYVADDEGRVTAFSPIHLTPLDSMATGSTGDKSLALGLGDSTLFVGSYGGVTAVLRLEPRFDVDGWLYELEMVADVAMDAPRGCAYVADVDLGCWRVDARTYGLTHRLQVDASSVTVLPGCGTVCVAFNDIAFYHRDGTYLIGRCGWPTRSELIDLVASPDGGRLAVLCTDEGVAIYGRRETR